MMSAVETIVQRMKVAAMLTHSFLDARRIDPTFWFTRLRVGNQQFAWIEMRIGGKCMLGKLCRLEKGCGHQPASPAFTPVHPSSAVTETHGAKAFSGLG
jgi:hypothetical protein